MDNKNIELTMYDTTLLEGAIRGRLSVWDKEIYARLDWVDTLRIVELMGFLLKA